MTNKMENPLDILSRAASMVETYDNNNYRDVSYKRISDRDSPSKHLPSKVLKYDRIRDHHDHPPPTTSYDHDRFNKKCISTQTSYTSFAPPDTFRPIDPLPPRYGHHTSPHFLHTYPPPSAKSHHNSGPLNLSSGHLSTSSGHLSPKLRVPNPLRLSSSSHSYTSPKSAASADVHDTVDDHFRRSLGKDYPEHISSKSSRSPSPKSPDSPFTQFTYVNALTSSLHERPYHDTVAPTHKESVPPAPAAREVVTYQEMSPLVSGRSTDGYFTDRFSPKSTLTNLDAVKTATVTKDAAVSDSVDDHFSKSLGDQLWSQLKVKGSVDDHFHKALGNTWLQIKAEHEDTHSNHSSSSHHNGISPTHQSHHAVTPISL